MPVPVMFSFSHQSVPTGLSGKDRSAERSEPLNQRGTADLEQAVEEWVLTESLSGSESSGCDWVCTPAALG